jgi:Zn-dependent hydrolases, including glyoxylases
MKQEIKRIDLNGVNCYICKTDEGFILFDTGGHTVMDKQFSDRCESLLKELELAGCTPGKLKLIVLTHGDSDHSANAAFLREKYKAGIAMHPKDLELVYKPSIDNIMKTYNYRSIIYKIVFVIMKKQIKKMTLKILGDFKEFKPDVFIDEGFDLSEYGLNARVVYIPGHTPGSIGILMDDGGFISGDIFTNNKAPGYAPNAFDFRELAKSIGMLKAMDIKTVYPGHGSPFEMKELNCK